MTPWPLNMRAFLLHQYSRTETKIEKLNLSTVVAADIGQQHGRQECRSPKRPFRVV